jgi:hypothetical protein
LYVLVKFTIPACYGAVSLRIRKREAPLKEKTKEPRYGRVTTTAELGALCREERRRRGLTLEDIYETTALSTRFLSEFERGKEHASAGRVLRALESLGLDVIVLPRAETQHVLRGWARQSKRT